MRPLTPKDLKPNSYYASQPDKFKNLAYLDRDLLYLHYIGEAISHNAITTKNNKRLPRELWMMMLAFTQQEKNTGLETGHIMSVGVSRAGKPLLNCTFKNKAENPLIISDNSLSNLSLTPQVILDQSVKVLIIIIDDPSTSEAEKMLFPPCLFIDLTSREINAFAKTCGKRREWLTFHNGMRRLGNFDERELRRDSTAVGRPMMMSV